MAFTVMWFHMQGQKKFIKLIGDIIIHLDKCFSKTATLKFPLPPKMRIPFTPGSSCPSPPPAPLSPLTRDHVQCLRVEWILQKGQWHSFLMLFLLTHSFHWWPVLNFFGFLIPNGNCAMSVHGTFLTPSWWEVGGSSALKSPGSDARREKLKQQEWWREEGSARLEAPKGRALGCERERRDNVETKKSHEHHRQLALDHED